MKTAFFASVVGLLALVPAVFAYPRIERTVEKTFTVEPGGVLRVETAGGDIKILPASDNTVTVTALEKIRASSEAEADKILENLKLMIEQSGNDVSASSRYEKSTLEWFSNTPVTVDFSVKVPANYNVVLKTSGGDVHVSDLTGKVDAATSGGDIDLARINGPVQARTSGGDVEISSVTGAAVLATSGGDIKVHQAENTVNASTSGGDVQARFVGSIKGDSSLRTSGGDIDVVVDKSTAFFLDAATSGGEVDLSDLTIEIASGGLKKSKATGSINGGGPTIKLRSSGGDIDIKAAK